MTRRTRDIQLLKLLASLFALFALYPVGVAIYGGVAGLSTLDWPRTSATILQSTWTVRGGQNTWKIPLVRYRYQVDGIDFESTRIQFGPVIRVKKRVATLPKDSVQPVYYDPDDPSHASLHRGVAWLTVLVYFGAGTLSFCTAMYLWKQAKKPI